MTLRDWTDPRDGRHWRVRQTGLPTVLLSRKGGVVENQNPLACIRLTTTGELPMRPTH